MNIKASIRHCLGNLSQFSGRDAPRLFWPYTLFLVALAVVAWTISMGVVMGRTFDRMQRYVAQHPGQGTVTCGPDGCSVQMKGHHPELMPDMMLLLGLMTVIVLVLAMLVAAAVTRRLHDSGVSGWVALVPLTLLTSGLALVARVFPSFGGQEGPNTGLFLAGFANNILYLASLAWLIYLLARDGAAGENRFGPPPSGE